MDLGRLTSELAFRQIDHRPWPVPSSSWLMRMRWHDLLFAHWPVDAQILRSALPAGLELDVFDGEAWLGVVPFRMSDVAPRCSPAPRWLSAFPELNLRTYVRHDNRPGVWFFTLEAASRFAVRVARTMFHLPYHDARMTCETEAGAVRYASQRTHRGAGTPRFRGRYSPIGDAFRSESDSLEAWLTERYCLYAARPDGTILRAEIHHAPWPLQLAEANIDINEIPAAHGFALPDTPPLLHFARRLDVVAWAPIAVG